MQPAGTKTHHCDDDNHGAYAARRDDLSSSLFGYGPFDNGSYGSGFSCATRPGTEQPERRKSSLLLASLDAATDGTAGTSPNVRLRDPAQSADTNFFIATSNQVKTILTG